jgi:hypothetical protein
MPRKRKVSSSEPGADGESPGKVREKGKNSKRALQSPDRSRSIDAVRVRFASPKAEDKTMEKITQPKVEEEPSEAEEDDGDEDATPMKKRQKAARSKPEKKLNTKQIESIEPFGSSPPARMFLGAHVGAAGGVSQAVHNAAFIGARAFALFTRNQRQWHSKPLDPREAEAFKAACVKYGYSPKHIVPHGRRGLLPYV